jgi:hypothetical protein
MPCGGLHLSDLPALYQNASENVQGLTLCRSRPYSARYSQVRQRFDSSELARYVRGRGGIKRSARRLL